MKKPQFILEVEENTGLECALKNIDFKSEWNVISPTGLVLFTIYGQGSMIGGVSMPDMYKLQGITEQQRYTRRRQGK